MTGGHSWIAVLFGGAVGSATGVYAVKKWEADDMGKVYLVGAGPGDPGLITLRGVECLQMADHVLYDCLVNVHILEHVPGRAELACLGKHGQSRIWTQPEINAKLIELARAGNTVVRLKGGDPAVFARVAEEVAALRQADVPFEIVPGVTSGLAAASYAEVPITHRQHASAVALIVGQQHAGQGGESLDFDSLASFPGTLIFYMGVTSAPTWTSALIKAGKPSDTPVLIIRRSTFPDQQTLSCSLGQVCETIRGLRPPAIMIVGAVSSLAPAASWFESRPLFGRTVMVTRPAGQSAELARLLQQQGADTIAQPAIEIAPPSQWAECDTALRHLDQFDWLVFSSANGVRALFNRLPVLGLDLRALGNVRLAAIGPGTAACLDSYHLHVDVQPQRFQAEDLADALVEVGSGQRFLLVRASRGREILAERLHAAGSNVTQVVVYTSRDVTTPGAEVVEKLEQDKIDWITVTSSAIARSLASLFGDAFSRSKRVSISPLTTRALVELGFPPDAEARQATMQGGVDAIVLAEMESG